MGQEKVFHRTGIHLAAMHLGITIVGILFLMFHPFGMNSVEAMVFLVCSQYIVQTRIESLKRFNGYGVASAINNIVRTPVVSNGGGLMLEGLFVQRLVRSWMHTTVLFIVLLLVAWMLFSWVSEATLPRLLMVFVGARMLALLGEIYFWIFAGRQRYWYITEQLLRKQLIRLEYSPKAIHEVVEKASEKGLLFLGV